MENGKLVSEEVGNNMEDVFGINLSIEMLPAD